MMSYERMLFKIKKLVIHRKNGTQEVTTGFLIPTYSGSWRSNRYQFLSIESGRIELDGWAIEKLEFKTTKVTNPELKQALLTLISKEKETYKLMCQKQALEKKMQTIQDEMSPIVKSLPKLQGLLPQDEFFAQLNEALNDQRKGYRVKGTVKFGTLVDLRLVKEVELGKYVNDGDFSFAYVEYDGNLMIHDKYQSDEQFLTLTQRFFHSFKKEKIASWTVQECFEPFSGDKRVLGLTHDLLLTPKKPLPLNEKTKAELIPLLTQLLKSL